MVFAYPWDGAVGACRSPGPRAMQRASGTWEGQGVTHLFYGQDLKLCWQWQFYQLCLHPRCLGIPNSQLPTPSSAHMWSHTDLLHEDFPGGRRHLYWLFLVASVISDLLWDEEQVPSPFGQGLMAAQRPKPIPQAVGHETCGARRCGVWPRGDTQGTGCGCGDSRSRPPESMSP